MSFTNLVDLEDENEDALAWYLINLELINK